MMVFHHTRKPTRQGYFVVQAIIFRILATQITRLEIRRFEESCVLNLEGECLIQVDVDPPEPNPYVLKMEAARSSETPEPTVQH